MISALVCGLVLGNTPDFAGPLFNRKLAPAVGERKVLTILWDPHREGEPAPMRSAIESLMFGPDRSVAGWFAENSRGKLRMVSAGMLGWYKADKPADHYWGPADPGDADKDGFVDGHVEKWAEALRKADREFDFKVHDANRNGILEPQELSVLIVIPQNQPFGTARVPLARQLPSPEPLRLDGVLIPLITETYAGRPVNLGLFAHELCHQFFNAPDLYVQAPHRAGRFSLMDCSYYVVHLDPFLKLKLGWLQPKVLDRPGKVVLGDVETTGESLILWSQSRGPSEYFIVENRWRPGTYDSDLPADGLVVWHIVEDPKLYEALPNIDAQPIDWGRRAIRLVRSSSEVDDYRTALGAGDVCRPRWADGTASGYEIALKGKPGKKVEVEVRRP